LFWHNGRWIPVSPVIRENNMEKIKIKKNRKKKVWEKEGKCVREKKKGKKKKMALKTGNSGMHPNAYTYMNQVYLPSSTAGVGPTRPDALAESDSAADTAAVMRSSRPSPAIPRGSESAGAAGGVEAERTAGVPTAAS
jgi:hypothetical protein